jgi:serine/threonine protein phosphatase PrpC
MQRDRRCRETGRVTRAFTVQTLDDPASATGTEDALLAAPPLFGVFDGATSLVRSEVRGISGGAMASRLARDVLSSRVARSLTDLVREANRRLAGAMDAAGVDGSKPENRWGTTAAVARVHEDAIEWVVVGDSVIVAVFDDGGLRPLAPLHDHDRDTKRRIATVRAPVAELLERLRDDLLAVRALANVEYGVINGDPAAERFIVAGRLALAGLRHLLLFTDGLLSPRSDPDAEDDLTPLVARFEEGGLEGARDLVRDLERSDRGCVAFPRIKPHDDIAAIALTFEP